MATASRPRRENPHSARSSSDVDVKIGKALKVRRRLFGLSQQELADKLGVTFQQIQKYENGTNRISASRLNQAAEILGVSITDFFTNVPKSNLNTTSSEADIARNEVPAHDRDTTALVSAFSGMKDPRARRCLLEIADLLAHAGPRQT